MDFDELFKVVRASPLVNSDRLLDAIQIKTTSKDIPYRGVLCTSEYQFEYYKFISRDYENKAICFNLIQCWTKMLQLQSMIRKLLVAITIKQRF